jgi:molybdate transport system substrate-binding protein
MTDAIRFFGAIAVRPAVLPLLSRFEAETGHEIAARWELNPVVKQKIAAGERFDVVITNPDLLVDLAAAGKVDAASVVPFGRIPMGLAARAGAPPVDIGSIEAFRRVLRRAGSVAYASEGTSGRYFLGLLDRLGIAAEMTPRLVPVAGGGTAATVAGGGAELGVVPVTSILALAPEVTLVGRFPAELQSYIDFAVGVSSDVGDAGAARRLSDFLVGPATDDALSARGVERRASQP